MAQFGYPSRPGVALQVICGGEKVTSRTPQHKGREELLPLCKVRRRRSGRLKEMELHLFPVYTFRRFASSIVPPTFLTHGVIRIVGVLPMPTVGEPRESNLMKKGEL